MTLCPHEIITRNLHHWFLPADPTALSHPIKWLAWSSLHHPIISAKIRQSPHISCPQGDGTWWRAFFSLLRCYVSRAEWNHPPSPFYCLTPKGGAIDTTYRSILCSRPITIAHLRHPITIGSILPGSNDPRSFLSCFFWYPCQALFAVYSSDPMTDISPPSKSSTHHAVHVLWLFLMLEGWKWTAS